MVDCPSHIEQQRETGTQECVAVLRRQKSTVGENVPAFLMDPSLGPRQKRTLLEKEMQERVSLIEELQKSGFSTTRIEEERKRLQDLENFAFRVGLLPWGFVLGMLPVADQFLVNLRISVEIGSRS